MVIVKSSRPSCNRHRVQILAINVDRARKKRTVVVETTSGSVDSCSGGSLPGAASN